MYQQQICIVSVRIACLIKSLYKYVLFPKDKNFPQKITEIAFLDIADVLLSCQMFY